MKTFKGKAIYNPSGKAGEYSPWACNFYTGCSNNCDYCYLKHGVLLSTWSDVPKLKKCFHSEDHALAVFQKELLANLDDLRRSGLFFTFTSDPMLPETRMLTTGAATVALRNGVPVKFLTKRACAEFILNWTVLTGVDREMVAVGFTLTGCDDKEPGASTNQDRIIAMARLHAAGYKTWASIEPVIDFESSLKMISQAAAWCDLFKIGLQSGKRYDKEATRCFITSVLSAHFHIAPPKFTAKYLTVYFKDSLLEQAGIARESLPANCVGRDYNIFNSK